MNINIPKCSAIASIGLMLLGFGGAVWAEGCIDPDPKYPLAAEPTVFVDPNVPNTYVDPNENESIPAPSVTAFDGNLTCDSTSGYFGGVIPGGFGTRTFLSPDESMQFTVESYLDNGKAVWKVVQEDEQNPPDGVVELRGIDATIAASSKGSKGCNTTFGVDAGSGQTAYEKKNGALVTSDLYVCANTTVDSVPAPPPPSPAVIKGCVLQDNDVIDIYGVTIQCTGVPAGEQRTVFIAKDTGPDVSGDGHADPVPGFGFTDENGVIDFNNVCICNGPDPVEEEVLCDPSPFFDGEEIDALEPCTVTDAVPALDITIQNPRCVTYGGSRRCY